LAVFHKTLMVCNQLGEGFCLNGTQQRYN
jgi:hypothetical protein